MSVASPLRRVLAERLAATAGRWPRELFGEAEAPLLYRAQDARGRTARALWPEARDGTAWVRSEPEQAAAYSEMQGGAPSARNRLAELGFDVDAPLYHGGPEIEGPYIRPSARGDFPEPLAVSLTPSAKIAADFGDAIYPLYARGKIGDAEAFMRRAREIMGEGVGAREAAERTQQEFIEAGFSGVRWGNREVAVFDPKDIRSVFARGLDGNSRDLLAGIAIGAPVAGLTLREALRDRREAS